MSRLNKLLKGQRYMTFRLAFGASYSTIVFTVKSLLIYFFPRTRSIPLLIPQSHLLYGGRTVAVELQNRVIPAVAVEILRWPQGHLTANPYVLQAAGVAVEL